MQQNNDLTLTEDLCKINVTYLCNFDLISPFEERIDLNRVQNNISPYVVGSYLVGSNEVRDNRKPVYLDIFREKMYEKRIREHIRLSQNALMIEFPKILCKGLALDAEEILPSAESIEITLVFTLNKMGVGTAQFWLRSNHYLNLDIGLKLREFKKLSTEVDFSIGDDASCLIIRPSKFKLEALLKTYLVLIYRCINSTQHKLNKEEINSSNLEGLYNSAIEELKKEFKPYNQILPYVIFHIDYKLCDPKLKVQEMREFITQTHKRQFRALITGDVNWKMKSDHIVDKLFKKCEHSTRNTTIWIATSEGSLKAYSVDFETELLESQILIVFEMERVLTMKYFLYKINYNLNEFAATPLGKLKIRNLHKLRDAEMRRLDEYYNLDISHKDTTTQRMEAFKTMLHIDQYYNTTMNKFSTLNQFLDNYYQRISNNRSLYIASIFGAYAIGNLVFLAICRFDDLQVKTLLKDKPIMQHSFLFEILLTIVFMLIPLILVFSYVRSKGKY
jgi:hypothetical protein